MPPRQKKGLPSFPELSWIMSSGTTLIVTVATLETRTPSLTVYVKLSVPTKPEFGVYLTTLGAKKGKEAAPWRNQRRLP